jgi:hypothetical protein
MFTCLQCRCFECRTLSSLFCCLQFSRYDEVFQALDTAITEMKHYDQDMRKLSSDRVVHICAVCAMCRVISEWN